MNTTKNLRNWFRQCPSTLAGNRFNVDYLGSDPTEYAIITTPSTLTYHSDITGGVYYDTIQYLNFVFASVESYGKDILQNLENLGFFDEVRNWILLQNKTKNFPIIREGKVMAIMPTTTQYLFDSTTDTGRYQIQCQIKYRRV